MPNGRYQWRATATDNAGRIAMASQWVNIDSVPPTVSIETPSIGSNNTAVVTSLALVSGRTQGASRVEVSLRNPQGLYWNGRAYQRAPIFLPAEVRLGRWSVARGMPAGASLPVGRYTLQARARDEAGNVATAVRALVVTSSVSG